MGFNIPPLILFLFWLLVGLASSSYISYDALEFHGSIGRNLLQATTPCPVNFETQNYTIITSACKGPIYNPKTCCEAFKSFSCPFADQINNLKTDCATTMFSYINLYGKYPGGLFANLCKDGHEGLDCGEEEEEQQQQQGKFQKSGALKSTQSTALVLIAGFLTLLYNKF